MLLLGTLNLMDEPHMDLLQYQLSTHVPPAPGIIQNTVMCMDLDETSTELEDKFPNHTQKATLLLPPPAAMMKYVDGDQEGFIEEYNLYLEYESSVQEFISSMIYFMYMGGNVLLYAPVCMDDDTIWINTLQLFFFTRYGISIGTSAEHPYAYDQNYDSVVNNLLYSKDYIDIFSYTYNSTYSMPSSEVWDKAVRDLMTIGGPESNPVEIFGMIKASPCTSGNGVAVVRPALYFGV